MAGGHGRKGWHVKKAETTVDHYGRPSVAFTLDEEGSRLFGELTSKNIGRPLCILLDGIAMSAPLVHSQINSDGVITGRLTQQEIKQIVRLLSVDLPAGLIEDPVSLTIVSPIVQH